MTTTTPVSPNEAVLTEALAGLTAHPQKTLPPWLFYDQRGSALFEQITTLPEYYLTRTERALFAAHSADILRQFLTPGAPSGLPLLAPDPFTIAELGAGTASKTGLLLHAATLLQPELLYQPIDVSPTALTTAADTLTAALPGLTVHPQLANYITEPYTLTHTQETGAGAPGPDSRTWDSPDARATPGSSGRPIPARRSRILALYIGSSIGNFTPDEATIILRRLRTHLQPGDALLLGTDLAPSRQKRLSTILAAYNDAAGVTAAFNLNILTRLNRELDADFRLSAFAHRVRWNAAESRIEMHLESLVPQTVHIAGHRIHFDQGDTIHTENSYKFTDAALEAQLARSGFTPTCTFHDSTRSFALTLAHTL